MKLTSGAVTCEVTLPKLAESKDHYALRITGISAGPGHEALFRVFVELPSASRSTPLTSENFVGPVTILAGPSKLPKNVVMPFEWPRQRNWEPGSKLRVTLVPANDYSANPIHVDTVEAIVTHSERR
jgi:hypothetical protein